MGEGLKRAFAAAKATRKRLTVAALSEDEWLEFQATLVWGAIAAFLKLDEKTRNSTWNSEGVVNRIEHAMRAAAHREREACAKIADDFALQTAGAASDGAYAVASTIRKRGA